MVNATVVVIASPKVVAVPKRVPATKVPHPGPSPAKIVAPALSAALDPTVAPARIVVPVPKEVDLATTGAPSLKEVAPMNVVPAPSVVRTTVARAVSAVVVVAEEAPSQAVMHLLVPPRRREPVVRPLDRRGPLAHGL